MAKKGGGGSNRAAKKLAGYAGEMAGRSEDVFNTVNPLFQDLVGQSRNFLSGGMDPTQTPLFGPMKSAVESQYQNARDNVLGTVAPGGALMSSLAGLEGQKADTLSRGIADLYTQERNQALQLTPMGLSTAFGGMSGAMSGLGAASGIEAQMRQAQQQRQSQAKQGLGMGIGGIIGGKPGASMGSRLGSGLGGM